MLCNNRRLGVCSRGDMAMLVICRPNKTLCTDDEDDPDECYHLRPETVRR